MVSVMELVREAKDSVENLSPGEVAAEVAAGEAVLVDIREGHELGGGVIPGALHAPRGMLEFHADASTKFYLTDLRPEARVILYCAAGSRSALGAVSLQQLGYRSVAHLDGGIAAWKHDGRPLEALNGGTR